MGADMDLWFYSYYQTVRVVVRTFILNAGAVIFSNIHTSMQKIKDCK